MSQLTGRFDLRKATPRDIPAVVALDRAVESAPHWPASLYAAMVSQVEAPLRRCLIVASLPGGKSPNDSPPLVGIAVAALHDSVAQLESVVVVTVARRSGLGRSLSSSVIAWARERGATEIALEVRAANAPAIALYNQLGFLEVARRPRYYRDPADDALLMSLIL